jgi:tetratricopeptide (TPR) repeat protein
MEKQIDFKVGDKIVLKDKVSFWNLNNHIVLEPGKDGVISEIINDDTPKCTFQNPYGVCQINVEKLARFESEEAQELIKACPKDPAVLTHEGYEADKVNQLDKAIDKYKEALKINPNFALARSNLGHAYKKQGNLKEAIKEWEETLKRGAPGSIAIPIPRNINEAKGLLYEQENINKDKHLPGAAKILKSYIKELGNEKANWRDIYPKVVRIGDTAIPILIKALGSRNETLQIRAVDLLIKISGSDEIEAFKEAYRKGSERLRYNIEHYIKDIDDRIKNDPVKSPEKKWWEFWK